MGARRRSRELALQALYALDLGGGELGDALASVFEEEALVDEAVQEFTRTILHGVLEHFDSIDAAIEGASHNWRLDRMPAIDRAVLRMATWELRYGPETPPAVIIDEAIEIARRYSTRESAKFVNGILDRVAKAG